uniref:Uncharacterized protein n=1 Tax=Anopheles stephensi TaxID=30069 RepID=A0A182YSX4_ANOST
MKNSDTPGAHYHTASGNPKTIVRGRYGSRQPDTGRVEETIYTAGPRGDASDAFKLTDCGTAFVG